MSRMLRARAGSMEFRYWTGRLPYPLPPLARKCLQDFDEATPVIRALAPRTSSGSPSAFIYAPRVHTFADRLTGPKDSLLRCRSRGVPSSAVRTWDMTRVRYLLALSDTGKPSLSAHQGPPGMHPRRSQSVARLLFLGTVRTRLLEIPDGPVVWAT